MFFSLFFAKAKQFLALSGIPKIVLWTCKANISTGQVGNTFEVRSFKTHAAILVVVSNSTNIDTFLHVRFKYVAIFVFAVVCFFIYRLARFRFSENRSDIATYEQMF